MDGLLRSLAKRYFGDVSDVMFNAHAEAEIG